MKPVVSDETLHAFVDGELDVAESEALIARMRDDKDLAQRVGALCAACRAWCGWRMPSRLLPGGRAITCGTPPAVHAALSRSAVLFCLPD